MLVLAACASPEDQEDPPVARAYEQVLRWSDLRSVVPIDLRPEDSSALAQRYINNWLIKQVVLHKAEQNLNGANGDLEAQLRDYRNSLVIYAYEQALVEQKLDTLVPMSEIERYHAGNEAAFELRDNIMRVRWFKVRDDDRRTMKRLEDHFSSGDPERMSQLEMWLAERGISIPDHGDSWKTAGALAVEVPPLAEHPLDGPGRRVLKQNGATWFVEVLEYRSMGSATPLELVRKDIRAIIINQRKLQLVDRMRQDIHREAVENKDIQVY